MKLETILKEKFGFLRFNVGQKEVIQDVIATEDTIAILPTGSGKSLCYQLPAYTMNGTVLIITPLVSLMEDQVAIMKQNGEKRVIALNSFLSFNERKQIIQNLEQYKFIFVSPEMLLQAHFSTKLKQLNLAFIVVDEAHCISQWGFDFRPDYLRIGEFFEEINRPNILALTATAESRVIEDVTNYLRLKDVKIHKYSLDRPNLSYMIQKVSNEEEKTAWIKQRVTDTIGPGIIYVGSRKRAEALALFLEGEGMSVASYHAGMSQEDRMFIQAQFLNEEIEWICATNAFGMGIHKDNIRQVIHEHVPATVANYVQEVGRAGRDGNDSIVTLLYTIEDIKKTRFIVQEDLPKEEEIRHYNSLVEQGTSMDEAANLTGLSETAFRVIQYYLERLSVKETICRMKKQREEKERQLQIMVKIIQSDSCIRQSLLAFFEEYITHKQSNCCSVCGEVSHPWVFDRTTRNKSNRQVLDWLARLDKLLG